MLLRCGSDILKPPSLVYLPEGTTQVQITALHRQGIAIDEDTLEESNATLPFTSGWVRLNPHLSLSPQELIHKLATSPREPTRRVVMYSGDTIHLFTERLASQTLLPQGKLLNAYYHHSPYSDGGILAGRYAIPYRTAPLPTMYHLAALSEEVFRTLSQEFGIPYDPETFKRYLIIASIIQKETWHTAEMPLVASVIANRLQRGMKLQLDATLNYGPYAHTPVTPERIRTDVSQYNTYRHAGLPPEPISSVTRAALRAAFRPAETNYFFFVLNAQGTHDFATTYTEHLANIARIKGEKERGIR
jgi:UPF0755 protein